MENWKRRLRGRRSRVGRGESAGIAELTPVNNYTASIEERSTCAANNFTAANGLNNNV